MSGSCSILERKNQNFQHEKSKLSARGKKNLSVQSWKIVQWLPFGNDESWKIFVAKELELPILGMLALPGWSLWGKQRDKLGLSQEVVPQAIPNISKQPQVWEAKIRGFWLIFQCCPDRGRDPTRSPGWFCSPEVLKVQLFCLSVLPFPVWSHESELNFGIPWFAQLPWLFSHITCWKNIDLLPQCPMAKLDIFHPPKVFHAPQFPLRHHVIHSRNSQVFLQCGSTKDEKRVTHGVPSLPLLKDFRAQNTQERVGEERNPSRHFCEGYFWCILQKYQQGYWEVPPTQRWEEAVGGEEGQAGGEIYSKSLNRQNYISNLLSLPGGYCD